GVRWRSAITPPVDEPFEPKVDDATDELAGGDPHDGPEVRKHAHGSEAGQGIDLVDERLALGREEKVDPRETGAIDRLERLCSGHLEFGGRRVGQVRGCYEACAVIEVLSVVVVELARRQDLADGRRLRVVVAEDSALDLADVQRFFDE